MTFTLTMAGVTPRDLRESLAAAAEAGIARTNVRLDGPEHFVLTIARATPHTFARFVQELDNRNVLLTGAAWGLGVAEL